jgi:hypothetical protein
MVKGVPVSSVTHNVRDLDLHHPGEGTMEVVDYSESLASGWAGESALALIFFT